MTAADLLALWMWAVRLSGYPQYSMPPVVVDADSYFEGNVMAIYDDATGVVHMRELTPDSFIVHEFVHALQPPGMALCARQREAYRVQNAYMTANGIVGHVGAQCPQTEGPQPAAKE